MGRFLRLLVFFVLVALVVLAVRNVRGAMLFAPATVEVSPGSLSGGAGNLAASDDQRVTWSEADVTANLDATTSLRPNGDLAVPWSPSGPGGVCDASSHFGCVAAAGDTPQDGNTTYISTSCLGCTEVLTLADWLLIGTDVTIDSLTLYAWARKNSSAADGFRMYFGSCAITNPTLIQAFANYSVSYTVSCQSGLPWTITELNAETINLDHQGASGEAPSTVTATAGRLQYDDRDFQVVAYVNFTGLSGYSPRLLYEGSESLSGETLELQVNRDGDDSNPDVWVSLASPFLTASEQGAELVLDPADIQGGSAQFRIVDSVLNEETGESFSLDLFAIQTEEDEPTEPGGLDREAKMKAFPCTYDWLFRAFECTARYRSGVIFEPYAPWFRWWLEDPETGAVLSTGEGTVVRLPTNAPPWQVLGHEYAVTVQVLRTNSVTGEDASLTITGVPATADDWPWVVVYLVGFVVLAVVASLGRRAVRFRRLQKLEGPEQMHWPSVPSNYRTRAIDVYRDFGTTVYVLQRREVAGMAQRRVSPGTTQVVGVLKSGKVVTVAIKVREPAPESVPTAAGA